MLTQLARSSEAKKIVLNDASMKVFPRFEQTGSIRAGTIQSRLLDVETELHIDYSAPKVEIEALVALAEQMCFLMDVIRAPHEVRHRTSLNGESLSD